MTTINSEEVKGILQGLKGKFFHIQFQKSDGTVRKMVARLGVKKHVKGVGLKFNPADYNLLTVFDMQKKEYRSIKLDKVLSIKIGEKVFVVNHLDGKNV